MFLSASMDASSPNATVLLAVVPFFFFSRLSRAFSLGVTFRAATFPIYIPFRSIYLN